MKKPFVDIEYQEGVMAYTSCRWAVVVGYEDQEHVEDSYAECYCVAVKPTARQVRKLMKVARQMIRDSKNDDAEFIKMIQNLRAVS